MFKSVHKHSRYRISLHTSRVWVGLFLFFVAFLLSLNVFAAKDLDIKSDSQSFFYVNGTSGNVGIATHAPNALLDVSSTVATDLFRVNDNGTGDTSPLLITSIGNVGVGSETPGEKVDVQGTVRALGFSGNGSALTGILAAGGWTDGTNVVYTTVDTDNVGIGTSTPQGGFVVTNGNVGIGTWAPNNRFHAYDLVVFDNPGFNTKVGYRAGKNLVSGATSNTFFGFQTGISSDTLSTNTADGNTAFGSEAFTSNETGKGNSTLGASGLYSNTTGDYNTAIGYGALSNSSIGSNNTAFGAWTLFQNGGASGNVALGYYAGYYEGNNNTFYIDNQDRTDAAGGKNKSLMYGLFAATPGSQMLDINANVGIGTWKPFGGLMVMNGSVGIGTWVVDSGLVIANGAGNVGIGTIRPGTELDVTGTVRATQFVGGGAGITGITAAGGFTDGTNVVYTTVGADNVGVGTSTPQGGFVVTNGNVGIGTWAPRGLLEVNALTGSPLIVDANGNVGIGTLGPVYKLGVEGSFNMYDGSTYRLTSFTTNSTLYALTLNRSSVDLWPVSGSLVLGHNINSFDLTIDTAGNVGIATSTPNALFDISSTAAQDLFRINDNGTGDVTPAIFVDAGGNVGIGTLAVDATALVFPAISTSGNQSAGTNQIYFANSGTDGELRMAGNIFRLGNASSAQNSLVFNVVTANLGIATVSSTSRLSVLGGVGIGTTTSGLPYLNTSAPGGGLIVEKNVGIGTFDPYGGQLIVSTAAGNVGVGSFAPGAQVDVTGTVRATQFVGGGAGITGITSAGGFTDGTNVVYTTVGADNVGIGTSTPQAGLVVTNGNVGIGTWTAAALEHIVQSEALDAFRVDDAAGDTSPFVITSDGNVGIGSTTPKNALDITAGNGNIGVLTSAGLRALADSGNSIYPYESSSSGVGAGSASILTAGIRRFVVSYAGNVGVATVAPNALLDVSSTAAYDLFRVNDNGTGDTSPFVIDSIGNVGIGSVTPGEKVDVQGTVRATQFVGGGAGITGISGTISGLNAGYLSKSSSATAINDSGVFQSGSNIGIGTVSPQTLLSIFDGNVGIGTITADNGRLIVMGGNVGIGTVISDYPFSVKGSSANEYVMRLSNSNTATTSATSILFTHAGNPTGGLVGVYPSTYTNTPSWSAATVLWAQSISSGGLVLGSSGGLIKFHSAVSTEAARFQGSNLGMGTVTPMSRLAVIGGVGIGTSTTTGQPYINTQAPLGGLIVEKNVGIGTFDPYGGQLIVSTAAGNVGVGSFAPGAQVDVTGTVRATQFVGGGAGITGITNAGGWTDNGTTVNTTTDTDNVGVGTFAANALLDISSTAAQDLLRINDNGTGDTTPFIVDSTGNIGIGTTVFGAGAAMKFEVFSSISGIAKFSSSNSIGGIVDIADTGTGDATLRFYNTNPAVGWSMGMDAANTSAFSIASGLNNLSLVANKFLTITKANGNVGIATFVPNALLDISSTATYDLFRVNDNGTGDISPFIIDSTGNVGIGTFVNNPTFLTKLSIAGPMTVDTSILFAGSNSVNYEAIKDMDSPPTPHVNSAAVFVLMGDSTDANYQSAVAAPPSAGLSAMGIYSSSNVGIGTFDVAGGRLIVTGGNVGIGSLTPGKELDVTGTVRATAFIGDGSLLSGVSSISGLTTNYVPKATSATTIGNSSIFDNGNVGIGTITPQAGFVLTNGNIGVGTWTTTALAHIVQSSPADAFRVDDAAGADSTPFLITSTGNVGIGTTVVDRLFIVDDASSPTFGSRVVIDNKVGSIGNRTLTLYNQGNGVSVDTGWVFQNFATDSNTAFAGKLAFNPSAGNVAIGTFFPTAALNVLQINAGDSFKVEDVAGDTTPFVIDSTGNVGIGTFSPFGGKLIIPTSGGNVGIGSLAPGTALDVTGTVRATAFSGDGSALTNVPGGGFTDDGTIVHLTASTDNVGIGTVDASQGKLIITGGNVGIGTTLPLGAFTVMNGNVGIGTWKPAGALVIQSGNVGIGSTVPAAPLDIMKPNDNAYREIFAKFKVSDAGNDSLILGNGTNTNSSLTAGVIGYRDSSATNSSLSLYGLTDSASDTSDATLVGLVSIQGMVSTNASDPLNGTLSAPSNRKILTVGVSGADVRFTIAASGNVGVGTTNPGNKLSVVGGVGIGTTTTGQPYMNIAAPSGGLIVEGNVGIGTFNPFAGKMIVTGGNVGIGSLTPGTTLDVTGTVRATAFSGDGSALTNVPGGGWTDGTNVVYTTVGADNVGIGTSTPQGGFVVTNGNVGIGTWAPSALGHIVQVGAANAFRVDDIAADTTPFVITSTGNVGIGTTIVDRVFMIDDGSAAGSGNRIVFEPMVGTFTNRTLSLYVHSNSVSADAGWVIQSTVTSTNAASAGKLAIQPSAGNVGIGTFFPTALLDVVQTGTIDSFKVQDAAGDTSPFVIDSVGNVGIGTSLPRQQLEITGSLLISDILIFDQDSTTNMGSISHNDSDNAYGFASNATFVFNGDVTPSTDATAPTAAIGVSGMYSSANVGIGTFRPTSLLSVGGGGVGIGTNSNSSFLQFTSPVGSLIAESNVGLGTYVPKGGLELKGTFIGRPSSTTSTAITAGGGVTVTNTVMRISGSGGAVDITANPQVVAGIDGQVVMLIGTSDTNTVKFDDATGLQLAGAVSFTMGIGDTLTLMYDGTNSVWSELGRSDN